jgi:hypothetical protein
MRWGMAQQMIPQQDAENRIFVRVASQISLTVFGENIFRNLQERVLKWAFDPKRNLRRIPDGAWNGETFEIDADDSERVAAIKLDDPKYWAFRLSERLKDPNRIWTTEVGIAERQSNEAIFGCRLICSQKGGRDEIPRSIPAFVRGIAFTQKTKLDGRYTSAEPWIIDDVSSVDQLVQFLQSPGRNHPVVVFSLPEGSCDPNETVIPVTPFIRRTVGYVHVAVITSNASFDLTDRLGREFSVYRQAVRTYNPAFSPDNDLSSDHPVATASRIQGWQNEEGEAFEDFLVHQTLRLTRPRDVLEREHPSFQQVKRIAAGLARKLAIGEGRSDAEILALAEKEILAAKQEAQASLDQAVNEEAEKEQVLATLRQTQASYLALQARLTSMQARLISISKQKETIPASLDDLEAWARENLSGDVELHERAIKAVRKSDFNNTSFIFDVLLMMRDYYVPMRRSGGIELKNAFDQRRAELGLENTPCFSQDNKAKNFGGSYFVKYLGIKRELDWHLKGSNNRDERRGFRMYYFWDAETSRVVVGYMPGHLENDIT